MSPAPEDRKLAPWRTLGETLAGSFAARPRGFLAPDFALLYRGGPEVGRLRVHGQGGAELEAGDLEARIWRAAPSRYAMLSGGEEILAAKTSRPPEAQEIRCSNRAYEARLSLLRNTAEVRPASGSEVTVRIKGGLTNRSYEVVFDAADERSLPIAVFLLYRLAVLRREAYRTSATRG